MTSQLFLKIKQMLNNCKTLETFIVLKVSCVIFVAYYERKNYTKSSRDVYQPWF